MARSSKATQQSKRKDTGRRLTKGQWDRITEEWRAGILTPTQLEKRHGVTRSAIIRYMGRRGITRNLSNQVDDAFRSKLLTLDNSVPITGSDAEIIELASNRSLNVVRTHILQLNAAKVITNNLLEELKLIVAKREEIEKDISLLTAEEVSTQKKEAMMRAVSLPANAQILSSLVSTISQVIRMEREAFGIDRKGGNTDKRPSDLLSAEQARKIASIILEDLDKCQPAPQS